MAPTDQEAAADSKAAFAAWFRNINFLWAEAGSKRLGKVHEFFTYEGANHAFMDFTNPDRYHEEAAKQAWPRTVDFFNKHLKGAAVSA